MEVFLAGEHPVKNGKDADWEGLNILETYYYLQNNKEFPRLIGNFQNFLLDSGAFTFMSGAGVVNFDKYVEGYAAFIKKWNVKNFFELDIDSVVGIKEVERLREKLERLSGRKPIPVWHKSRGKEYFVEMCKNYPYVAIGGIVTKEIPINKYEKLFPWFVKTAHKYGCKIHALGYTNIRGLHTYHFDSVDSTAWLYGNMSGSIYKFNAKNGTMDKTKAPKGKILGISKIGRVVDYCSARLQIQERLVHDIVDMLKEALGSDYPPLGIALVMKGHHSCKEFRGAKKKGIMTSSYLEGAFKDDPQVRAEFMNLVNGDKYEG